MLPTDAADDWSQRADSRFNRSHPVFSGPTEFGGLATVLHRSLKSCGLQLLMQTWTAGSVASGLEDFVEATPPDITLVSVGSQQGWGIRMLGHIRLFRPRF